MRRTSRILVAIAVAAASVLGLGATATAGTTVTVTATDVTYTQIDTFTGSVDVGGLDTTQPYDIVIDHPDGTQLTTERTAVGETSHHVAPSLTVGTDPAGTYTVTVSTVATETTPATQVATGTFRVIEPVLTLRRYTKREMDVRLTLDGVGMNHRVVHVLEYYNHQWNDQGGIWSSPRGWVGIYCKKHYRCTHSFRFAYRTFVLSDVFQLYTGPANGRYADVSRSARIAVG